MKKANLENSANVVNNEIGSSELKNCKSKKKSLRNVDNFDKKNLKVEKGEHLEKNDLEINILKDKKVKSKRGVKKHNTASKVQMANGRMSIFNNFELN